MSLLLIPQRPVFEAVALSVLFYSLDILLAGGNRQSWIEQSVEKGTVESGKKGN